MQGKESKIWTGMFQEKEFIGENAEGESEVALF